MAYKKSQAELEALLDILGSVSALEAQGWRLMSTAPKDGTSFWSCSVGSTGVHRCSYRGEWPKGTWWIQEAGDLWPASTGLMMWKPIMPGDEKPSQDELDKAEYRHAQLRAMAEEGEL